MSILLPDDRRKLHFRLKIIQVVLTCLFAVLAISFWSIQVVQYEKFRELAENNHQRVLALRAPRGILFDRSGHVLVENGELAASPGTGRFVRRARFGRELAPGREAVTS